MVTNSYKSHGSSTISYFFLGHYIQKRRDVKSNFSTAYKLLWSALLKAKCPTSDASVEWVVLICGFTQLGF